MLKTLDEIGVKAISGKFLAPQIKKLNKIIYQYSNTPVSTAKANEIVDLIDEIKKTNQLPELQLFINKLTIYIVEFIWCVNDKDILQRVINYNVARWIKTREVNDDETIISHLQRWLYTKQMVEESPYKDELKMDSFNRLNKDFLNILNDRYK